jgi:hypothetical protein
MDEPAQIFPPSPSRLSKTPSWVTLGFVLGALFVWALPRAEQSAMRPAVPPATRVQLARPQATEIEAVFAQYGQPAVWDNDVTEVALWDVDRRSYSLCYEVLRNGENFYFRSIPRLTRPVLTHGVPGPSPLRFTETEAMRREWLEHVQSEPFVRPAPPAPSVPGKP